MTLSLRGDIYYPYGPQEFEVHSYTKGIELEATEMDRIVERL